MSDPVRDLLDRLERDVARVPDRRRRVGAAPRRPTPPPSRGARRGGISAHGGGHRRGGHESHRVPHAHQPPAASSAPSLPSPTASPTEEPTFTFLTPSALPDPATGGRWQVVDAQPDSAVARCVDPASTGATASEERWFATGSNPEAGRRDRCRARADLRHRQPGFSSRGVPRRQGESLLLQQRSRPLTDGRGRRQDPVLQVRRRPRRCGEHAEPRRRAGRRAGWPCSPSRWTATATSPTSTTFSSSCPCSSHRPSRAG